VTDTEADAGRVEVRLQDPVSPGEHLKLVLDRQGVSQAEIAARSGLSTKHISQLIRGHANLGLETASALEFATGVDARVWMKLDAEFQAVTRLNERRQDIFEQAETKKWFGSFNVKELVERRIVPDGTKAEMTEALLRFFGVAKPAAWQAHWGASLPRFRRSPSFAPEAAATAAWLRIGQLKARETRTSSFDADELRRRLELLRAATQMEMADALPNVQQLAAEAGVAVVFAAEVSGCRASGAAWWEGPDKAVVLLSNRGKREDRLWFSLFHELGHVLLHARRDTFLDQTPVESEGKEDDAPPWHEAPNMDHLIIDDMSRDSGMEREADDFAQRALLPDVSVRDLVALKKRHQVEELANSVRVSAAVVAGRCQYETGDYKKFNALRRPIPEPPFLEPPRLPYNVD
jgi:HTH-type transcriptional regulator/antitoxin HigA